MNILSTLWCHDSNSCWWAALGMKAGPGLYGRRLRIHSTYYEVLSFCVVYHTLYTMPELHAHVIFEVDYLSWYGICEKIYTYIIFVENFIIFNFS